MAEQRDTYELFPAGYLDKGCVAYLMGAVREVTGDLYQAEGLADPYWNVPCRLLDGTEVMAPPIDRGQLVPIRTDGEGHKRPAVRMASGTPNPGVQDSTLIGLDIDDLLGRLRRYVGRGESIPSDLFRKLDSWMSRGYQMPKPWRHGQLSRLLTYVRTARRDQDATRATLQRLEEEIRDTETKPDA